MILHSTRVLLSLLVCLHAAEQRPAEDGPSLSVDQDQWDRSAWLQRHKAWTASEPFHASQGDGSCTHPMLARFVDIPVLYINLDAKSERRAAMERYYGCLNLIRVPGVLGSDPSLAEQYLSHPLAEVPGLVDEFRGDPTVRDDEKRPQSQRGRKMFLGALGCFVSHIKAAYTMLSLGVNAVLVLEDDMTPDLVPYWLEPSLSALAAAPNMSAFQLSIQTSEVVWAHLKQVAAAGGPSLLSAHNDSGQTTWLASNGAYLLTRQGASSIMKTLMNPQSLRLNLSGLTCINIDICLFPFLAKKAIVIPPLFLHMPDGDEHSHDAAERGTPSSIISDDSRLDQAQQLLMRWRSREHAIDMAMDTYIRRPAKRLAYQL